MPLHLYFRPSFKRSLKPLAQKQKETIALILEAIIVYYSSGCSLMKAQKVTPRFFYKQLRRPYYEAEVERNLRVIFYKENEKCITVLAGNHDQIKRFLAKV
ncbi:MAG: hypothetical protein KKF54_06720 [Candidatus Omnitrophica bacterium]|nr:hypothetical protein [Candidatus Omnitrophota bacterium]